MHDLLNDSEGAVYKYNKIVYMVFDNGQYGA